MNLFADADLTDEAKDLLATRGRTDNLKKKVVYAMRFVSARFAEIAGTDEVVLQLDSGGGFYTLIHHDVTKPISENFSFEERAKIYRELVRRFNMWLKGVHEAMIKELKIMLKIDLLNNKNRLMKVPLSIHKKLDWYVHPVDIHSPEFEEEKIPLSPEMLEKSLEWVKYKPPARESKKALENIISELFKEFEGSWKDKLQAWLESERRREKERKEMARRIEEERRRFKKQSTTVTDNFNEVIAAIRSINLHELVAPYITEDRGDGLPRFSPPWRKSRSGTSCFASEEFFFDLQYHAGGDVIKFVALVHGLIPDPTETVRGADWWKCVKILREMGYNIPEYRPLQAKAKREFDYIRKKLDYELSKKRRRRRRG